MNLPNIYYVHYLKYGIGLKVRIYQINVKYTIWNTVQDSKYEFTKYVLSTLFEIWVQGLKVWIYQIYVKYTIGNTVQD